MRVAWQVRRISESAPAAAVLLPSDSAADVLAVHAQLGPGQSTLIYSTRAGLLVTMPGPSAISFPGAIRLRALAEHLLVPVDAELIPALHPEEARELVRQQGLIILPHREVLAFAPGNAIPLARFVAVPEASRPPWTPFPKRPARATRIERILLERPEDPELDILGPGGEGIGDEADQGQAPTLPYRIVAWLSLAGLVLLLAFVVYFAARLLGRLGTSEGPDILAFLFFLVMGLILFARFLAKPLTKLIRKGAAALPFLSARVLQQQDAALRALLRKFQAGKIDEALRRALPISSFAERGSSIATNAQLPAHNLLYSLRQLLGAGGPTSLWRGGAEAQLLLAAEYRKVAAQAAARGDHRRAAFIYAKLLGDFRSAANVLHQGGLFHDAAILFLKRVHDKSAAALGFEAGGEFDRALALYLEMGQTLQAAELLRRTGDEERALEYFEEAAQECVSRRNDYLAAGELMRTKAGRVDLARSYYEQGWASRPAKNDVLCALALARIMAAEQASADLRILLNEAEDSLAPKGREREATDFFNAIARLASTPGLAPDRDELRDRCLVGLAGLLRGRLSQDSRPGKLVSSIFGASGAWDPALVSDADYAWKAELRERPVTSKPRQPSLARVRFKSCRVTAACSAPGAGHLVLGFEDGVVGCFDAMQSRWWSIAEARPGQSVVSLATTMEGDLVVARFAPALDPKPLLRGNPRKHPVVHATASQPLPSSGAMRSYGYSSSSGYRLKAEVSWEEPNTLVASLLVHYYGVPVCAVVKGNQYLSFDGSTLVCISLSDLQSEFGDCDDLMQLPSNLHDVTFPVLLARQGATLSCSSAINRPGERNTAHLGWTPRVVDDHAVAVSSLSWGLPGANLLELAGIDDQGIVHYSEVDLSTSHLQVRTAGAPGSIEVCLAASLVRPGLVAGVLPDRIVWFQAAFPTLKAVRALEANFRGAAACFPSARTDELLVVFRDGEIARVPVGS